jgi:hypothetical protein
MLNDDDDLPVDPIDADIDADAGLITSLDDIVSKEELENRKADGVLPTHDSYADDEEAGIDDEVDMDYFSPEE